MVIYPQEYSPLINKQKSQLPASESCFLLNLLGLIPAFLILIYLKLSGGFSTLIVFGIFCVTLAVSVLSLELFVRNKNKTNFKIKFYHYPNLLRIIFKLSGLFFIWAIMAMLYWLLPMYNDNLFNVYFYVLQKHWWIGIIIATVYFIFMDCLKQNAEDVYYQLGCKILFRSVTINRTEMIELWRGWAVKFFYLALMLPYLYQRLNWFLNADFNNFFHHPYSIFYHMNQLIFLLDLAFAAIGYVMTFRIFNTHIRSSEPTLLGWFAALACYWPFWGILFNKYFLQYGTGVSWVSVWQNSGIWFILWMSLILLCELIYTLSTIALGIRFSNLTYRGLVTSGPYRFTKHPAYVFKNISWWMISMPFMAWSKDWELALRGSILLLGVNALYYLRAKTEENHLSHYPEYVEYALAMNSKSIFSPIAKILPFLKYQAPNN